MTFLEFLPISGTILCILAFIVSVWHSQSLLNSHINNLQDLLITKDKLVSGFINPDDIENALKLLTNFTLQKQPNSIIGINRGGAMIGGILALQTKIPSKNYIQCHVSGEKFDCPTEGLSSPVMIIDDISRTGRSMRKTEMYIKSVFPSAEVITASLFSYVHSIGNPAYKEISYYALPLANRDFESFWNKNYDLEVSKEEKFTTIEQSVKTLAKLLDIHIKKNNDKDTSSLGAHIKALTEKPIVKGNKKRSNKFSSSKVYNLRNPE